MLVDLADEKTVEKLRLLGGIAADRPGVPQPRETISVTCATPAGLRQQVDPKRDRGASLNHGSVRSASFGIILRFQKLSRRHDRHLDIRASPHHIGGMRTTLCIDDDVLNAAKSLAAHQRKSLGQVISDLIRKGLRPTAKIRRGGAFPVFRVPDGARPITLEAVKQAEEDGG